MSLRNRIVAGCVVVCLLGTTAACSEDGDPAGEPGASATGWAAADEQAVRDQLAATFAGDHSSPTAREEAACFADALLERVDVAALTEAGVVGQDGTVPAALPVLDATTAGHWVDAQAACTDFVTASTRALTAQSRGRLDGIAYGRCLTEALTEDQLREAQVQALSGGMTGPAVAALTDAQSACAAQAQPAD